MKDVLDGIAIVNGVLTTRTLGLDDYNAVFRTREVLTAILHGTLEERYDGSTLVPPSPHGIKEPFGKNK